MADEDKSIEDFSEAPDDSPFGEPRLPSLFWALVPILCMAGLMLYVFGWVADSETYNAAHLPLLCSTLVACAVGIAYGRSFKYMLDGILHRLLVSMEAILILLLANLETARAAGKAPIPE